MTDKQIIICGINVSECKYRDTYTNFCKAEKDDIGECYTICTGNDCYYKQLARKEQECEKLKQTLTEIKEICKFNFTITTTNLLAKTILQKISECEV